MCVAKEVVLGMLDKLTEKDSGDDSGSTATVHYAVTGPVGCEALLSWAKKAGVAACILLCVH